MRPDLAHVELPCIFGEGCQGHLCRRTDVGCCTLARTSPTRDDEKRVAAFVGMLDEEPQQKPAGKVRKRDWIEVDEDGERKTRVTTVDGQQACVPQPDRLRSVVQAGRRRARLHALAFRLGEEPGRDRRTCAGSPDPPDLPRRSSARTAAATPR